MVPSDPFTDGLQLMQRGELRAALAVFEPLLDNPDDGIRKMARLYACEALLQLGDEIADTDLDAALECYESASGLQPSFADIHQRIGRLRLQRSDLDRAAVALTRALEINPRFFAARLDLIETSVRRGDPDLGRRLDELEAHAPAVFAADVKQVRELVAVDNREAVVARILAMRERTPDPRDHVKHRAVSALQDGVPERAIELLEGMMHGGRRYPDLLHLLGLAYGAVDRHVDAERAFRDAIAIHPRYAKARVNLALSLMEQERWTEAEEELKSVLEIEPAHPLALGALDEIRAQTQGN